MKVRVKFPDGSVKEYEASEDKSLIEIDPRFRDYVVAKDLDTGQLFDLTVPVDGHRNIEVLTFDHPEGREVFWHSSAHILAQAVKRLFPEAKLTIGPPIENGFFYDIDFGGKTLTPEDLEKIEQEAYKIIEADYPTRREEWDSEYAKKFFKERGEDYKVLLIEEFGEPKVSVYWQGEFVDLCRGPHIPRTGLVKAFKVLSVSGAYWKGDENNPQLQRIYGISFPTREQLDEFLHMYEEAKKRDHRVLGKQLELFDFYEEAGPGLVFWHPKGALLRSIIEDYSKKKHLERGYQLVQTPHVLRTRLWEISGHLEYYRENMFLVEAGDETYGVKPMNCPAHILIYRSKKHSYRELPIKFFELGTVYRYEKSGVLHGLLRVRGFTQDDSHIFATPEQIEEVVLDVLELMKEILGRFGFDRFDIELSTYDPENKDKYMGSEEEWINAQNALENALKRAGLEYRIAPGEAAFYGPKIDVQLYDVLGRKWQCTTIQLDFNLPKRFGLTYVDKDGKEKTPVIIHRAIFGSVERFIGILIEHYAGDFPLWLAPVQVSIVPVSDKFMDYAKKVEQELKSRGFRVYLDDRKERVGYKIRDAEVKKIPYTVVVGKREMEEGTVSVRKRKEGDLGAVPLEKFIEMLNEEVKD